MAGIATQMIYLGDDSLRRISPVLTNLKPEFAKRIAAFFTDGKDHPTWVSAGIEQSATSTHGVTVRVDNRGEDRELRGTVAVDVRGTAGPQTTMSLVASLRGPATFRSTVMKQSFKYARQETMKVLVHELRHVMASWSYGLVPGSRRNRESQLYAAAYAKDGYFNEFERDAFKFAGEWIEANSAAVDAGKFDDMLPISMIQSLTT